MVHTIVTHPGGAHKDDLLAVCVLAALHGCPIVRREPTPEELDDPQVAVVDIGGIHDPARSNFDHHHFPREHATDLRAEPRPRSSRALPGRACSSATGSRPQSGSTRAGPRRPASGSACRVARSRSSTRRSTSTLLRRFAQTTRLEPDRSALRVHEDGRRRSARVPAGRARAARLHRRARPALDDPVWRRHRSRRCSCLAPSAGADEPSSMLGQLHPRAEARRRDRRDRLSGSTRRRASASAATRIIPSLDFSRVEGQPDVHFAHKSGFMCKTSASEPDSPQAARGDRLASPVISAGRGA